MGILWKFFGNLLELSLIVYIFKSQLVFTFLKSADCLQFKSQLIFYTLKVKAEGRRKEGRGNAKKFKSLEVRGASSSHLEMANFVH